MRIRVIRTIVMRIRAIQAAQYNKCHHNEKVPKNNKYKTQIKQIKQIKHNQNHL